MEPPHASRIEKLKAIVEEESACSLLLTNPGNTAWAIGVKLPLLVTNSNVYLLAPPLEALRAYRRLEELSLEDTVSIVVYQPYRLPAGLELGVDVKTFNKSLIDTVSELAGTQGCRLLVDSVSIESLEKLSKRFEVKPVARKVMELRMVKEWWEITLMEEAARIAEDALVKALNSLREGVSETEIAAVIEYEARRRGAEDHSFPPIVAFDENTVYPHAEPSPRRRLSRGSIVLIDLGVVYRGYCSDMTRTTCFDRCSGEAKRIVEAVNEAVEAAIDSVEPGKPASEVDEAARKTLARHGLDKYFIHSLGHGVGVEVHEEPRLAPNSRTELKPGMVVTIEPGVYIPSKHVGARIEEMIVVTKRGAKLLTRLPRIL